MNVFPLLELSLRKGWASFRGKWRSRVAWKIDMATAELLMLSEQLVPKCDNDNSE